MDGSRESLLLHEAMAGIPARTADVWAPPMKLRHRHTEACTAIARLLEEHLDGKTSHRTSAAIRKHLKDCPNCTAYLDSLKKTVMLYRCYPDPKIPMRTRQELLAILHLPH